MTATPHSTTASPGPTANTITSNSSGTSAEKTSKALDCSESEDPEWYDAGAAIKEMVSAECKARFKSLKEHHEEFSVLVFRKLVALENAVEFRADELPSPSGLEIIQRLKNQEQELPMTLFVDDLSSDVTTPDDSGSNFLTAEAASPEEEAHRQRLHNMSCTVAYMTANVPKMRMNMSFPEIERTFDDMHYVSTRGRFSDSDKFDYLVYMAPPEFKNWVKREVRDLGLPYDEAEARLKAHLKAFVPRVNPYNAKLRQLRYRGDLHKYTQKFASILDLTDGKYEPKVVSEIYVEGFPSFLQAELNRCDLATYMDAYIAAIRHFPSDCITPGQSTKHKPSKRSKGRA